MTDQNALTQLKRQVSSKLLDLPGVSGVGLRGDSLVVYLATSEAALRERALSIIRDLAPGRPVIVEVSGTFGKQ